MDQPVDPDKDRRRGDEAAGDAASKPLTPAGAIPQRLTVEQHDRLARGLDPDPPPPKEKPFKFVVRLPLRLRNQIADAAKYYRRSMNSEIVDRLERSFNSAIADGAEEGATSGDPLSPAQLEALFGRGLTGEEEQIVIAFRRLSREKQRAVLDLIT